MIAMAWVSNLGQLVNTCGSTGLRNIAMLFGTVTTMVKYTQEKYHNTITDTHTPSPFLKKCNLLKCKENIYLKSRRTIPW